jgi:hypothetical protein
MIIKLISFKGLINSYKGNQNAAVFTETMGVVFFDVAGAKYVQKMNKKQEKNKTIRESTEEIEWLNNFIEDKVCYTFHGEHRRNALLYLHNVIILINIFLVYNYY